MNALFNWIPSPPPPWTYILQHFSIGFPNSLALEQYKFPVGELLGCQPNPFTNCVEQKGMLTASIHVALLLPGQRVNFHDRLVGMMGIVIWWLLTVNVVDEGRNGDLKILSWKAYLKRIGKKTLICFECLMPLRCCSFPLFLIYLSEHMACVIFGPEYWAKFSELNAHIRE
jgi:hypothetical protein